MIRLGKIFRSEHGGEHFEYNKESLVTPEVAKVLRHICRYCAARFKTPEEKKEHSIGIHRAQQ
jgi:hypothetical protein